MVKTDILPHSQSCAFASCVVISKVFWSFSIWEPRSHPFRIFIAIMVVLPMPNGLLLLLLVSNLIPVRVGNNERIREQELAEHHRTSAVDGAFSLMQLYLPFIVVVLAIVSISIDSLNNTGHFSLTRLCLYYLSTVEGSFRGRSGIWQFQGSGFPPLLKRVLLNPRTKQHTTHNPQPTLVIGQQATPQSPIRPN
jgi:hypothetical protein